MEICDKCGVVIENENDKTVFFIDEDNQYFHSKCFEKVYEKYLEN